MNLLDIARLTPREQMKAVAEAMKRVGMPLQEKPPDKRDQVLLLIDEGWMPPSDMPLPVSRCAQ